MSIRVSLFVSSRTSSAVSVLSMKLFCVRFQNTAFHDLSPPRQYAKPPFPSGCHHFFLLFLLPVQKNTGYTTNSCCASGVLALSLFLIQLCNTINTNIKGRSGAELRLMEIAVPDCIFVFFIIRVKIAGQVYNIFIKTCTVHGKLGSIKHM